MGFPFMKSRLWSTYWIRSCTQIKSLIHKLTSAGINTPIHFSRRHITCLQWFQCLAVKNGTYIYYNNLLTKVSQY